MNLKLKKGVFSLFQKSQLYALITYVTMLALTAFIPLLLFKGIGVDPLNAVIYTNIVAFFLGAIIIYSFLRNDLRIEKETHPITAPKVIGWSLLGIFLAWFSQGIAALIEMQLFGITPSSENTELIVSLTKMNPLFLFLPALIGPIIEELIFRKVIFNGLRRKMNVFVAAILSSIIFGLFHLEIAHLLIYFAMGIVFTFLYVQTKRIIVPIIVHMSLNTITVLLQLTIDPEQLQEMQQQLSFIFFGS